MECCDRSAMIERVCAPPPRSAEPCGAAQNRLIRAPLSYASPLTLALTSAP